MRISIQFKFKLLFCNTGFWSKIHHYNDTYMYIHTIELVVSKTVGIYVKTINTFTYAQS